MHTHLARRYTINVFTHTCVCMCTFCGLFLGQDSELDTLPVIEPIRLSSGLLHTLHLVVFGLPQLLGIGSHLPLTPGSSGVILSDDMTGAPLALSWVRNQPFWGGHLASKDEVMSAFNCKFEVLFQ